jgi:hypothetical protein
MHEQNLLKKKHTAISSMYAALIRVLGLQCELNTHSKKNGQCITCMKQALSAASGKIRSSDANISTDFVKQARIGLVSDLIILLIDN